MVTNRPSLWNFNKKKNSWNKSRRRENGTTDGSVYSVQRRQSNALHQCEDIFYSFQVRQDITSVWGHTLLISGQTGHYISVRTYSTHFRSDRTLHQCEDIFYSFHVRQDITSVWGHILLISGQTGYYISKPRRFMFCLGIGVEKLHVVLE